MTAVYQESGGSAQEYHLRRFDNNFKYLFFRLKILVTIFHYYYYYHFKQQSCSVLAAQQKFIKALGRSCQQSRELNSSNMMLIMIVIIFFHQCHIIITIVIFIITIKVLWRSCLAGLNMMVYADDRILDNNWNVDGDKKNDLKKFCVPPFLPWLVPLSLQIPQSSPVPQGHTDKINSIHCHNYSFVVIFFISLLTLN